MTTGSDELEQPCGGGAAASLAGDRVSDGVIHGPSRPARPGSVAQAGRRRLARDRRHDAPAALALHAVGALDRRCAASPRRRFDVGRRRPQLDLRDDEQHRQLLARTARAAAARRSSAESTTFACSELPICLFLRSGSISASTRSRSATSVFHRSTSAGSASASSSSAVGKQRHVHRLLARARQVAPQLVGGERQDRRQQPRQAVGHQVHRRLRRAPLARPRPRSV